jgi:hypothetical protein
VTPETRARLALIADALIPAAAAMPSASAAGVHERGIDRVLELRPDLESILARVTASALDGPEAARAYVAALQHEDRPAFSELLEAVSAAYFLDERVAQRLGYRRREAVPIELDADLGELVAPVLGRGPAYRSIHGL